MTTPTETIDAVLLSTATDEWVKIAVIISKVFDAPALAGAEVTGQAIAERLYILVDNGALDSRGNMRRWRDADVRLPERPARAKPLA